MSLTKRYLEQQPEVTAQTDSEREAEAYYYRQMRLEQERELRLMAELEAQDEQGADEADCYDPRDPWED